MNGHENENVQDLFERFVDAGRAADAADDIEAGRRLLAGHPPPLPDPQLIARVKESVAVALAQRRRSRVRLRRRIAAVAAAIVILCGVGLLQDDPSGPGLVMADSLWDSQDVAGDDLELVHYRSQLQRIEQQLKALQSDQAQKDALEALSELEVELQEISEAEFWKG